MPRGYRKCTSCGTQVPSDIAKIIDGKAYCTACGEARLKEIADNVALRDYLYQLCGCEKDLMPFLMKQVQRMKSDPDYGFKSTGILATLKFIFDTSENPPAFKPEYGIEGLVIQNYYKARKHYEKVRELNKFPELEIDEALNAPEKEIHINKGLIEEKQRQFLDKMKDKEFGPLIDLNSIEDEEESDEEV